MLLSYGESIRHSIAHAMRKDERVYLFGEDVAGFGGVFGVTKGLVEEFGNRRVRNTPLSESAIIGEAIGAALGGLRPIAEIQFSDFMTTAFSHIVDFAANYHYRFNTPLPLVIRAPHGGGMRIGNFHSKCNEAWYFHVPGLKIVCPASPYDVKGLMLSALEDLNPVLFFEEKKLYWEIKEEVPEEDYKIPLGEAKIKKEGDHITVITYGSMLHMALKAAQMLEREKINLEVIDLRSLMPLDTQTFFQSIKKTNRALILHEAVKQGGIGGEIVSLISEFCFDDLAAPPLRIAAEYCPVPVAPVLEDAYLPSLSKILEASRKLMRY